MCVYRRLFYRLQDVLLLFFLHHLAELLFNLFLLRQLFCFYRHLPCIKELIIVFNLANMSCKRFGIHLSDRIALLLSSSKNLVRFVFMRILFIFLSCKTCSLSFRQANGSAVRDLVLVFCKGSIVDLAIEID